MASNLHLTTHRFPEHHAKYPGQLLAVISIGRPGDPGATVHSVLVVDTEADAQRWFKEETWK